MGSGTELWIDTAVATNLFGRGRVGSGLDLCPNGSDKRSSQRSGSSSNSPSLMDSRFTTSHNGSNATCRTLQMPDAQRLFRTIDATWPAARMLAAGPWTLREGHGGGKRVSAATASGQVAPEDVPAAEEAMRLLGQNPVFMIRQKDQALDAALADRGYRRVDPVNLYRCKVHDLTNLSLPPVSVFHIWEPLAIMREIWEQGGVGPARQAIMERARAPRTGLFGRIDNKPAAAAFVGLHDGVAMLHALETLPEHQRKGLGKWMVRAAAHWASDWGATWLTTLCVQDNRPGNKLYQSLGMEVVAQYHYRMPATA